MHNGARTPSNARCRQAVDTARVVRLKGRRGAPGVLCTSNGRVAWETTREEHDSRRHTPPRIRRTGAGESTRRRGRSRGTGSTRPRRDRSRLEWVREASECGEGQAGREAQVASVAGKIGAGESVLGRRVRRSFAFTGDESFTRARTKTHETGTHEGENMKMTGAAGITKKRHRRGRSGGWLDEEEQGNIRAMETSEKESARRDAGVHRGYEGYDEMRGLARGVATKIPKN
ncbi:hypothetical protein C8J57DRAFT_1459541 [Mycena rebaudengoi]|nr:hypothetical protein C8J57DRAFT_1459541 [Mycena rebaudengoi]